MMPQQNPEYGKYEGAAGYSPQQQYRTPYETPPTQGAPYDEQFSDPMSQRMSSGPGSMGKVYTKSQPPPSAGMRLALAIVSLGVLVPLAGIMIGILHGGGILVFGIACIAIVLVNAIFNNPNLFKS